MVVSSFEVIYPNHSLDQVQVDNRYNFKPLYQSMDCLDENGDSPYGQGNQDCKYYEPYQLSQMIECTKIALSSFHLNCRSSSSNWDAFYNILCDLDNKEFSFDVIGVSEVFRVNRNPRIVLTGYHNIITRCRGLFIKDSIIFLKLGKTWVYSFHMFMNPCLSKWKMNLIRK